MVNCSCIKGNYNYLAKALDKNTIIYQDLSDWMTEEGYDYPTSYSMQVIPPATSKTYEVVVQVGQLNRLKDTMIGTIKDGVYCFIVTSCGTTYTRSTAIFPHLQCCIDQLWATMTSDKYPLIEEVERHLNLVKINAELNNMQMATSELSITKKLLENLKCDCDC